MKINKLLFIPIALLFSTQLMAQIEYGATASVGVNNFKYKTWNYWYEWDGTPVEDYMWICNQEPDKGWSLGGFTKAQVFNSRYSLKLGCEYQYLQSKKYNNRSKITSLVNFNRIYLPLTIHYDIAKWFSVYAGANYAYTLKYQINEPITNTRKSNFGYLGGFDFKLIDRFTIGAYFYDSFFLDYHLWESVKLGFKAQGVAFKVSYTLSPLKEKQVK